MGYNRTNHLPTGVGFCNLPQLFSCQMLHVWNIHSHIHHISHPILKNIPSVAYGNKGCSVYCMVMYGCDLFQLVSTSTIHIGQDLWLRPRCETICQLNKVECSLPRQPMFPIGSGTYLCSLWILCKDPSQCCLINAAIHRDAMFGLKVIGFPWILLWVTLAQDTHGVWTPRVCVWAAGQQIAPICTGEEPQEFFYTSWVWVEIFRLRGPQNLLFLSITAHKSRYSHSLSRWNLGTPNFDPALWSVPPLEGQFPKFHASIPQILTTMTTVAVPTYSRCILPTLW